MQAQENFGIYVNKIFLNVFSKNPDSSIRSFLAEFVPNLLDPPENVGGWTAYPEADMSFPTEKVHSFIFHKHPFIDAQIKKGEFKVYTAVYNATSANSKTDIKDIQVILLFEKLDDANELFEKLRNELCVLGGETSYFLRESERYTEIYSPEFMNSVTPRYEFTPT
jgi:hypothetical protein